MVICAYGCRQEAIYQFKNGKWCCEDSINKCINMRSKNKILHEGKFHTQYTKIKQSRAIKEAMKRSEIREKVLRSNTDPETRRRRGESLKGKMAGEKNPFYGKHHVDSFKNKQRLRMTNGGAAHAQSFIKNPSAEELALRKIVKEIYAESKHTYKVLEGRDYNVDNALVEEKIAIEFDGYHHFKDQRAIDYHNDRQKEIEIEGWKFIRYNIFQKFPSKEQVKQDILRINHRA